MPLSDLALKKAKPQEKPYKLADEKGLYVLIQPTGSKLWRMNYRHEGRQKTLYLGTYPDVTIAGARDRRDDARKLLADGIDPAAAKQSDKLARKIATTNSLEAVAREWFAKFLAKKSESYRGRTVARLEKDLFPWLGKKSIADIEAPDLLACLQRTEARGAVETARRIRQICSQIFRYAIATGRAKRDPAADLIGAIPPVKVKHRATITDPLEVGKLLRAMESYRGTVHVRIALQLAPLLFLRPGELRNAEWSEIDLDNALMRIEWAKMKMKEAHLIPLSTQAIALIQELRPLTGHGKYLFPNARTSQRPMSDNAILSAIRRLGYDKDELCGHGLRAMASTLLNEARVQRRDVETGLLVSARRFDKDVIERQLAHGEKNAVRAAYNHAEYLAERQIMMQWWADHLDKLKAGAEIIPLHPKSA